MDSKHISWPGWETTRLIGRGSFGVVYEIQREIRGRTERAAMKVISLPHNESELQELRADGYDNASITQYFADSLEKIEEEYALMANLKGHSNVVYCDDIRTVQHEDGLGWDIYIKMELLTPLKSYLSDTVTDTQVIKLGMDICDALKFCEDLNIVHRDIKPENIFVSRNGDYKLGDFGIAKTMEGTTGGTKTGTYDYMSPEVFNNLPYHTHTDIYSLGLVMYWLLNNRTAPFLPTKGQKPTPSEKKIARVRRFSGEKIPAPKNGSEELKQIVLKACAFDPKDRYQSAREMREDLMRLSGEYGRGSDVVADLDEEETVGSIFKNTAKNIDKADDKTVGPVFYEAADDKIGTNTVEPVVTPNPRSKLIKKIAICFAAVVVVIVGIIAMSTKSATPNVLMSDVVEFQHDEFGKQISQPVFGTYIKREQIKTITFLDSMKKVPRSAWDVSEQQNGSVLAWVESNGNLFDLYIAGEGGVSAPENCYRLFAWYSNLEEMSLDGLDTSLTTDMHDMFLGCCNLKKLDLSDFDTSLVTNMRAMFYGCENISEIIMTGFNTSSVTNMMEMFSCCTNLSKLDVSNFDTSKVSCMAAMFYGCNNLAELNVSRFNTSSVIDINLMFGGCNNLTKLDVSNFDLSNATETEGFYISNGVVRYEGY